MKNLYNTLFPWLFIIAVVSASACSDDDSEVAPAQNDQPSLNVGDDIIGITGTASDIEITASDPDGDALTITWNITTLPDGSNPVLTNTSETNASFNTDIAGLYEITIQVDDQNGGIVSDVITLYIGGLLPTSISTDTSYPNLFEDPAIPDYYALSNLDATAGVTLAPGVVIENGSDVRLWFNGNNAFLLAEGTDNEPIIFRGREMVAGYWRAISIESSNTQNKLDHVQILHAGSTDTFVSAKTAIHLRSNVPARLSISNTLISQSDGYGIYADGNNARIDLFESNSFTDNASAPLRLGAENLYMLDQNSAYTGNGIQAIEVASAGNTNARFDNPGTIPAQPIPYHFLSSAELRAEVTFAAGVTCLFDSGKRLWVTSEGVIIADGTASEQIVFDGMVDAAGAWLGIEIQGSNSPENLINQAVINNGGNNAGRGANIYMFGSSPGSQLTLTNSSITNSQSYGIWATSGNAVLNDSGNTFINNQSGNIRQD